MLAGCRGLFFRTEPRKEAVNDAALLRRRWGRGIDADAPVERGSIDHDPRVTCTKKRFGNPSRLGCRPLWSDLAKHSARQTFPPTNPAPMGQSVRHERFPNRFFKTPVSRRMESRELSNSGHGDYSEEGHHHSSLLIPRDPVIIRAAFGSEVATQDYQCFS
jgi:hypothetical protein